MRSRLDKIEEIEEEGNKIDEENSKIIEDTPVITTPSDDEDDE